MSVLQEHHKTYFHCWQCKKLFSSQYTLRRHLNDPQNHVFCKETTHEHNLINEQFETMSDAKAWVNTKELDKTLSIATSRSNYALYHCRHYRSRAITHSCPIPNTPKRRKVTPKPVYPCHAQFSISMSTVCTCVSNDEFKCKNPRLMVQIRGCTTHSHKFEICHHRISKVTKDIVITLLKTGVPKATILEKYCFSDEYDNLQHKLITMQDLTNLERLYVDLTIDKKKTDFENLCKLIEREDLRGFSFEGTTHPPIPEAIRKKMITTGGKSAIIYASNAMLERFRKNPSTLFIDGTHGTNRSKFILITLMVKDARGEGTPVLQIIAESESVEVLKPAFRVLYELAPDSIKKVKVLLSDLAGAFSKAWQESFPDASDAKTNGWTYFEDNYGPNGKIAKPREWARCFTLGVVDHNLNIERYHRTIKDFGLNRNKRMDELCFDLIRVDQWYRRKQAYIQHGIRGAHKPSRIQVNYGALHPESLSGYSIIPNLEGFNISSKTGNYFLTRNKVGCLEEKCLVMCFQCPRNSFCAHSYVCNCMAYSFGNMCKHSHVVAMMTNRADVDHPKPSVEDSHETADVDHPETSVEDRHEPAVEDRPEPTDVDRPEPTDVDRPEPTDVDGPEPADVDRPEPTDVDGPEPADVDHPETSVEDRHEPADFDGPEPTDVDRPEPTDVDGPEPADVDRPEPADVDHPEPSVEDRHETSIDDLHKQEKEYRFVGKDVACQEGGVPNDNSAWEQDRRRLNAISIAKQFIDFLESDRSHNEKSIMIEGLEDLARRAPPPRKALVFSTVDRGRKRERVPSIFKAKKLKQKSTDVKPVYSSPTNELIKECSNSPIDQPCWMFLLTMNTQSVLKKIHECSSNIDIGKFMESFDLAKGIWQCKKCHDLSVIERNLSGYIECEKCEQWFHAECVGIVNVNDKADEKCSWECPDHDGSL